MIYTLTLNPALDYVTYVDNFNIFSGHSYGIWRISGCYSFRRCNSMHWNNSIYHEENN